MNQNNISDSLLTILLVVIESILTLLLKLDSELRQAAYPLTQSSKVIRIKTYLPHQEIFATFTTKGILLDSQLEHLKTSADVTINAYSFQILIAMLSDKPIDTEKLQFIGEASDIEDIKTFFLKLSLNQFVSNLSNRFLKNSKSNKNEDSQPQQEKATDYKEKSRILNTRVSDLDIENQKLRVQLKELESRRKIYSIFAVVGIISLVLSVAFIIIF